MRTTILLAVATFGLFLSGCAVVKSDKAIGEKAVSVNPDGLEGIWIFSGGAVNVAVTDKDKGILEIAWLERKDGKFEMKTSRVIILQQGDTVIANVEDTNDKGQFSFGRIKINPDEIILWIPDFARFKALVLENKLPGKIIEENKIILNNPEHEQMKIITGGKDGSVFLLDSPVVLKRSVKLNYQNNK
jgi:hypothetical protein